MSLLLDGTLGIVATGNISGGNVIATGALVVSSFEPASVSTTGNVTGASFIGSGQYLSSIAGANVSGAVATATTAGTVTTAAQGNITSVGTLTSLAVTGNVSAGNLTVSTGTVTVGNIVNSNGNGVGNIGATGAYFNTIFAKATSAQYADLAEMYCADAEYAPGTVLDFGGAQEVTATTQSHSTQVAGIVSTNPSYLMNSALDCTNAVEVALVGRVPCRVIGTIAKGDRLVASDLAGVATRLDMSLYQPGCIVGKALEDYNSSEVGVIEVAVGRL